MQANTQIKNIKSEEILKKYEIWNFVKQLFEKYTTII
jgi:hypothetical protein